MSDSKPSTSIDPTRTILLTSFTPHLSTILSGIVHVHAHCILHDSTLATYLPPLSHSKMLSYWHALLSEVSRDTRRIIVSLQPVRSRTTQITLSRVFAGDVETDPDIPTLLLGGEEHEVAGVVSLAKPNSETGPFRGELEKLLTSPNHRRKGIARIVIREFERVALEDGRWAILLGTIVESDAEKVYERLGYRKMGVVEEYGIDPKSGSLVDASWYSKDLRKSDPI